MKHTTTKFALLLAVLAAGNSAMAQTKQELPAGLPYTFSSTPATGGSITYQWFRDGQPIPGATEREYILPGYLAYGTNVEFECGVISSSCPGNVVYTNVVRVAFGLKVGNVFWASVNVGSYQNFASRPDMYTEFYQWNKSQAWPATGDISNWNLTSISDPSWTVSPCPTGWELPTQAQYIALHNTGSTWANANTRGNAVNGRFYGPNNASCTLPNNMFGCIFFPASGNRYYSTGSHMYQGINGYYWSSTKSGTATNGIYMSFGADNTTPNTNNFGAFGFNLRCVKQ